MTALIDSLVPSTPAPPALNGLAHIWSKWKLDILCSEATAGTSHTALEDSSSTKLWLMSGEGTIVFNFTA